FRRVLFRSFIQPIRTLHEDLPAIAVNRPAGDTLESMLESYGRFDAAYSLELFILLIDGLRTAHRSQFIHHHIHPGNIFLAQHSDGVVTPQLMDFGHNRIFEGNVGELGASCYFVAPELEWRIEKATPCADIYALGMCLYRTICGRLPLEASSP